MQSLKLICITLLFLAGSSASLVAQTDERVAHRFSGRVRLNTLGEIEFPRGEWILEAQSSIERVERPLYPNNVMVFRKLTNSTERLSILKFRKKPEYILSHLLDYINLSWGGGLYRGEGQETGLSYSLGLTPASPKASESFLFHSSVWRFQDVEPQFLCHSIFTRQGAFVYVIMHASAAVINPEEVQSVFRNSAFQTE